jgi:hypothetical protein
MTDLGDLHHFLGVSVHQNASGMFLSQQQYTYEILERAHMTHCNPISTPVDTRSKPSAHDSTPFPDASLYRSLAGALQYLTVITSRHCLRCPPSLSLHACPNHFPFSAREENLAILQRHLTLWSAALPHSSS